MCVGQQQQQQQQQHQQRERGQDDGNDHQQVPEFQPQQQQQHSRQHHQYMNETYENEKDGACKASLKSKKSSNKKSKRNNKNNDDSKVKNKNNDNGTGKSKTKHHRRRNKRGRDRKDTSSSWLCGGGTIGVFILTMISLVGNVHISRYSMHLASTLAIETSVPTVSQHTDRQRQRQGQEQGQQSQSTSPSLRGTASSSRSTPKVTGNATSTKIDHDDNENENEKFTHRYFQEQMILANRKYSKSKKKQFDLTSSLRHHTKFFERQSLLHDVFEMEHLYGAGTVNSSLLMINDQFAYRHIFKNGGTTMERQVGRRATTLDDPDLQDKHWFTFVRDPIEHFISGWAECSIRMKPERVDRPRSWLRPYDERVAEWLKEVKALDKNDIRSSCMRHSFPQGNFLLTGATDASSSSSGTSDSISKGNIYPQVAIIGDLDELKSVMQFVGVPYNETIGDGRVAATDPMKKEYFPFRKDLLSRETIKDICEFVAIDYFLFDFKIPKACRRRLTKVIGPDYVDTTTTAQTLGFSWFKK